MPDITEEVGTAGLRSYSGVVNEEYDYKLAGAKGRSIYRQMQDDPIIGAMLFAIDRLIRQVQWKIEPGDDEEAAQFIDECHVADTPITTQKTGLTMIQSLHVGDSVLTHNGQYQKVTEVMMRVHHGPLYRITRAARNTAQTVTPSHPFYIARRPSEWWTREGKRGDGGNRRLEKLEYEWANAETLKIGDFMLEPVPVAPAEPLDGSVVWEYAAAGKGRPPIGNREVRATAAAARLVGYYLAEGFCDGGTVKFALHKDEVEFHNDILGLIREVFGVGGKVVKDNGNGVQIHIYSRIAKAFFLECGTGSANKHLPEWLAQCSNALTVETLVGYFRGDGDRRGGAGFRCYTVSAALAEGMRRTLLSHGVVPSFRHIAASKRPKYIMDRPIVSGAGYELNVTGGGAVRLGELLGLPHKSRGRNQCFIYNGYAHYPITKIEVLEGGKDGTEVYNLEVEHDHSYLADGVISHNCRVDMSQTWADLVSEILSMLPYGWSYFEIVYKVRGGNTDTGATRSRHRDGRIGWRKWALRAQDSLHGWQLDDGGGVQAMVQRRASGRTVPIPIEKSLHFRTSAYKGNPEGRSLLRSAYRSWYFRTNIENIEGIGIERDLAGLPVVKVPAAWLAKGAEDWQKKLVEQMLDMVKNVRRNEQEGVVLPSAFDKDGNALITFELLASSSRRQFDTSGIIQRKNVEIDLQP